MQYIFLALIVAGTLLHVILKLKKPEIKKAPPVGSTDSVAQVMCGGIDKISPKKYNYDGISDCQAASQLFGGPKNCSYGCFGLASCADACPEGAIHIIGGIAAVDRAKCNGCGKCISACPKGIIELIPRSARYWVGCSYCGQTPNTEGFCEIGCNGCADCVTVCTQNAIAIKNGRAHIDYELCVSCGACADICKRKSIWKL